MSASLPWGKWDGASAAPYPASAHLLDTAAVALALWRSWLSALVREQLAEHLGGESDIAARRFALVAGSHDLGKFGPLHQGQLLTVRRNEFSDYLALLRLPVPAAEWRQRAWAAAAPGTPLRAYLRHEALSGHVLQRYRAAAWVSAAVSGHHGRYLADLEPVPGVLREHHQFIDTGAWAGVQDTAVAMLGDVLDLPAGALTGVADLGVGPVIPLVTGLICLADWLASDETFLVHGRMSLLAVPREYFDARLLDATAHARECLGAPVTRSGDFVELFGFGPSRPAQQWATGVEHGPGLVVVTVPMGDGKTETALWRHAAGAELRDRLLWALPTTATADAMLTRVLRFYAYSDGYAHLAHGRALLNAFYQPSAAEPRGICDSGDEPPNRAAVGLRPGSWFSGRHRALTAPVGIATCDQVLAAALAHKFAPVRLAALAGMHVVLDEVHTYDPYQDRLLCRVLGWLGFYRCRVTLLSATLPTRRLRDYVAAYRAGWDRFTPVTGPPAVVGLYPAVTTADSVGVTQQPLTAHRSYLHRLAVHRIPAARFDVAAVELVLQARAGHPRARIGVIVNRVDRAVAVARLLAGRGEPVLVLHSRMTFRQREATVAELLERTGPGAAAGPVTVVATQLAEASLDIDLDVLCTDLAPMASLLQRAGRQWRHSTPGGAGWTHPAAVAGRRGDPVLHILVPVDESGALDGAAHYPYSRAEMLRTWLAPDALAGGDRDRFRIPQDVQTAVDAADVRLEDLELDDWADADPVVKHIVAAGTKVDAADRAGIDAVAVSRGWRAAMLAGDGWAGVPALAALTRGQLWREEAVTRLRDADMVHVVLYDPAGRHEVAWPGGLHELLAVRDRAQLVDVVGSVVPVSGRLAGRLRAAAGERPHGWHPVALLDDVLPLPVNRLPAGYRLDPYGLHNDMGGRH